MSCCIFEYYWRLQIWWNLIKDIKDIIDIGPWCSTRYFMFSCFFLVVFVFFTFFSVQYLLHIQYLADVSQAVWMVAEWSDNFGPCLTAWCSLCCILLSEAGLKRDLVQSTVANWFICVAVIRWDLAARENGMVETIGANSVWDQGKQNKVIQHSQTPHTYWTSW